MQTFYFDYNATTPVHNDILPRIFEYAKEFGNPSSLHKFGRKSLEIVEEARNKILDDFPGYKLVFTSSGTEANYQAFQFLRERNVESNETILLSAIEHPCIDKQMYSFQKMGYNIIRIPVLMSGRVDLNFISDHLNDNTQMVTVMGANNETGVIQPIREITELCKEKEIYFHCDMSQIPGKLEEDFNNLDIDSITISAHKFYGLKGVGALLYKSKPGIVFKGGLQEKGLRAGTENILGIQVMGVVYQIVTQNKKNWTLQLTELRSYFESLLRPEISIIGNLPNNRIANTSCILLPKNPNDRSVLYLDSKGFLVSRGAACHSGVWEPSPILIAMGYSREEADTAIRVSFGIYNTKQEVESLAYVLNEMVVQC
jgi:cysteine desulfurase